MSLTDEEVVADASGSQCGASCVVVVSHLTFLVSYCRIPGLVGPWKVAVSVKNYVYRIIGTLWFIVEVLNINQLTEAIVTVWCNQFYAKLKYEKT